MTFNARRDGRDQTVPPRRFQCTRCLIPASGYYEWKNKAGGKQPHYFTRAGGEPLTFARLWDAWICPQTTHLATLLSLLASREYVTA